jgi:hypothetical protein
VAVPTAGKSRTTTEILPVRRVHGEEGPKTVDLHPKKQKPRTPANHKNADDRTDRKKPVTPQTGRVRADDKPTTADHTQKQRKPKKDQKEEEKELDQNKKRTGGGGGRDLGFW